ARIERRADLHRLALGRGGHDGPLSLQLLEPLAARDHGDAMAGASQLKRERAADGASADDRDPQVRRRGSAIRRLSVMGRGLCVVHEHKIGLADLFANAENSQTMTANLQASDWDDVRVFLALWRARSLGQAASRLGVDISTASRRLAALEAQLGARLFERTRQGLAPTHAAEVIQPAAELMESAHAR